MTRKTRREVGNGYQSEEGRSGESGSQDETRSLARLPRSLSSLETWGFGLVGHLAWIGIAPGMHAALGPNAIWVWLPAAIAGIVQNLQIKRLGEQWPEMSGGTPNYITRLLRNYPLLGRYAAIAYFATWAMYPAVNAIILADIVNANLEPSGITCPPLLLKIAFTLIAYILAFSGTRALGILHSFFAIPAAGFLLLFSLQGILWLAFSPASPGIFPSSWPSLSFADWAKWAFMAIYGPYACETASSFVADSKKPGETLRFLSVAAGLIPPVFLAGSWVLMRLATASELGDSPLNNLLAAASPFWGTSAPFLVTLLLASSCLLASATSVSNAPRVLYQLALDGYVSPVFAIVSRRGVLEPALAYSLLLSLVGLIWGDLARLIVVGCASYTVIIILFHLGIWLHRGDRASRSPKLSAGIAALNAIVLAVGGSSWSPIDVWVGFLVPVAAIAFDAAIRRIPFAPFHPAWWIRRYRQGRKSQIPDFVAFQVLVLILLICSSVGVGWVVRTLLETHSQVGSNLLVVLLMTVAFVGVAVACWTSLPQVISMDEAREAAEQLFTIALDAIAVLDEKGAIRQLNPAAERLFGSSDRQLLGRPLNELLPGLADRPENWPSRSEQLLSQPENRELVLEVAISNRFSSDASQINRDLQEYVVILRDISDRKRAQESLEKANEELELKVEERTAEIKQTVKQLQKEIEERQRIEENLRAMQNQIIVQEKLASLGSLTAGIAHEIRNPLNFINNFSELSAELAEELAVELENQSEKIEPDASEYIGEILTDLKENLKKINNHGQRAERIVGNMLLHSRGKSGQWEKTDVNGLLAEYVNLAYHGMRAKDTSFNIAIETEYQEGLEKIEVVPQDIGRVFLNIINNACYATHKKKQQSGNEYSPLLRVRTRDLGEKVEIRIWDNGPGMNPDVRDKIFNPFFTTKPTGEGTGLGLSISHDIVVGQHRGELKVESEVGNYAEFIITLLKKQSGRKEETT